jgi:glucan phosphoethanolaminetransferase (alkaline phosphatase superfamily)
VVIESQPRRGPDGFGDSVAVAVASTFGAAIADLVLTAIAHRVAPIIPIGLIWVPLFVSLLPSMIIVSGRCHRFAWIPSLCSVAAGIAAVVIAASS